MSAKACLNLTKSGQIRPELAVKARIGRFGQDLAQSGQCWPQLDEIGARMWPKTADLDRGWALRVRSRGNLSTMVGQLLGNCWAIAELAGIAMGNWFRDGWRGTFRRALLSLCHMQPLRGRRHRKPSHTCARFVATQARRTIKISGFVDMPSPFGAAPALSALGTRARPDASRSNNPVRNGHLDPSLVSRDRAHAWTDRLQPVSGGPSDKVKRRSGTAPEAARGSPEALSASATLGIVPRVVAATPLRGSRAQATLPTVASPPPSAANTPRSLQS